MNGMDCLFHGLQLITRPGLRRYVIVPLIINVLVLVGMTLFAIDRYEAWTSALTDTLPDWLSFLSGLVSLLAVIVVALVMLYLFTIIANVIAAPFNAILSVKVEEHLIGYRLESTTRVPVAMVKSLWREILKVLYYLPRLIGLVIVSFIPVVNVVSPALWLAFGAWMMAVEYSDYAADNNEVGFRQLRERLRRKPVQALAFGLMVYLLLAIPGLNLVLIPAAVAGGTVFWVEHLKRQTIL